MKRRLSFFLAGGLVAVLLLVVLLGLSDLGELGRRASELRASWIAAAVAASLVSYAAIAGCQRHLLAVLGHAVPAWAMVRAVTVSTVANRSVRTGGATGVALLAWLVGRRGVPASAVLTSSVGFIVLTNALFGALFLGMVLVTGLQVLAGGAGLGTGPDGSGGATDLAAASGGRAPAWVLAGHAIAAASFLATLGAAWVALFSERVRGAWVARLTRLVSLVGRLRGRSDWEERTAAFLARFDRAAAELRSRRRALGGAWAWSALRIATSIGCLWLCFAATGTLVGFAVLVLSYTAGKTAGVVSLVPGGLGVVEGSLVGVAVALGVDYETALLAALLNRATYHLLPAAIALAFSASLVRPPAGLDLETAAHDAAADGGAADDGAASAAARPEASGEARRADDGAPADDGAEADDTSSGRRVERGR